MHFKVFHVFCFLKYNFYYDFNVVPYAYVFFVLLFNKFLCHDKWLMDIKV